MALLLVNCLLCYSLIIHSSTYVRQKFLSLWHITLCEFKCLIFLRDDIFIWLKATCAFVCVNSFFLSLVQYHRTSKCRLTYSLSRWKGDLSIHTSKLETQESCLSASFSHHHINQWTILERSTSLSNMSPLHSECCH